MALGIDLDSYWSPSPPPQLQTNTQTLKNDIFVVHLSMFLQILYPLTKDPLALSHILIGLKLLYANMQPGIAKANNGPETEPIIHNIHGPQRTEHQSNT